MSVSFREAGIFCHKERKIIRAGFLCIFSLRQYNDDVIMGKLNTKMKHFLSMHMEEIVYGT